MKVNHARDNSVAHCRSGGGHFSISRLTLNAAARLTRLDCPELSTTTGFRINFRRRWLDESLFLWGRCVYDVTTLQPGPIEDVQCGEPSAGCSGAVVTHTYAALGVYTAVVTATNSVNSAAASTVVTVTDVPITGLSIAVSPSVVVGSPAVFTATQASGTNVAYAWSVDSVAIGSGNPISYTFTVAGTYTVTVMATNSRGSVTISTLVVATALTPRAYLPVVIR